MSPEPDSSDGSGLADALDALFRSGGKLPPKSDSSEWARPQEPSEEEKLWELKKPFIQHFIRHFVRTRFDQTLGPIREEAARMKTRLEAWQNTTNDEVIRTISLLDVATFSDGIFKGALRELAGLSSSPGRSGIEATADFYSKIQEIALAAHELG